MGSNIYTRTGDKGETSLVDGSRVAKNSLRVESYGTVDECNSWVGAARAFVKDENLDQALRFFQHRLFNCSSNLATPEGAEFAPPTIVPEDIAYLEKAIDQFESATGPLKNFILPGGTKAAAMLHVARTVCRRAERRIIALVQSEHVDEQVRKFVNRGSDFLFAAARYANFVDDKRESHWKKEFPRPQ